VLLRQTVAVINAISRNISSQPGRLIHYDIYTRFLRFPHPYATSATLITLSLWSSDCHWLCT